jgi:hypothetical protein
MLVSVWKFAGVRSSSATTIPNRSSRNSTSCVTPSESMIPRESRSSSGSISRMPRPSVI